MPRFEHGYIKQSYRADKGGLLSVIVGLPEGEQSLAPPYFDTIYQQLNVLGADGWELVAVEASPDQAGPNWQLRYWLRRSLD